MILVFFAKGHYKTEQPLDPFRGSAFKGSEVA